LEQRSFQPFRRKTIAFIAYTVNEFEISVEQYLTHYSPAGNGDVLNIVVHKNVQLSEVTVSDILDPDNLSIVFH
jgi:hypothetical protein